MWVSVHLVDPAAAGRPAKAQAGVRNAEVGAPQPASECVSPIQHATDQAVHAKEAAKKAGAASACAEAEASAGDAVSHFLNYSPTRNPTQKNAKTKRLVAC